MLRKQSGDTSNKRDFATAESFKTETAEAADAVYPRLGPHISGDEEDDELSSSPAEETSSESPADEDSPPDATTNRF